MAVEPAIGRDVTGDVPATTAEVADEDTPAAQAAEGGSETSRQYVLLMAMNHVGFAQLGEHRPLDWVEAFAANIPGFAQHADSERPHRFVQLAAAEAQQRGRHDFGHMTRQFERIALGTSGYVVRAEHRGHQVDDSR